MSTRGIPTRSKGPPAERMPSLNSARSAKHAVNEIVTPFPASNTQDSTHKWRRSLRCQSLSRQSWDRQENFQSEKERDGVRTR